MSKEEGQEGEHLALPPTVRGDCLHAQRQHHTGSQLSQAQWLGARKTRLEREVMGKRKSCFILEAGNLEKRVNSSPKDPFPCPGEGKVGEGEGRGAAGGAGVGGSQMWV